MNKPLIAIVGPTASGKTSLSLKLAMKFSGEIIAADSRTVYRGMDIGTAKPTGPETGVIRHHLLDIIDPGEPFSAAEFKELATSAIEKVHSLGHLPIIVGGTGLYVDSVIYNYQFPSPSNFERRDELLNLSVEELQSIAMDVGVSLNDSDWHNPRRLMRAIETGGAEVSREDLRENTLILGLLVERDELEKRIKSRLEEMITSGLEDEVRRLGESYGFESEAMTGIGYKEIVGVVLGTKAIDEARAEIASNTLNFAKRQMTWFKRNKDIRWCESQEQATEVVEEFMASQPQ